MTRSRIIAAGRGQAPADLILTNGRVVNIFTGEIELADVAIAEGRVVGIGSGYSGDTVIDLKGRYLLPGLIDGHVHLESSLLAIGEYAKAVVPLGTTAIVTDLHEVANVCGLAGARRLLDAARRLPLDVYFTVPSCVPATHLETAGARVDAAAVATAMRWPESIGLGEVMNYPGVLFGDPEMLAKLDAAEGTVRTGHAPGLAGNDLNAYIAAGISSDHESTRRAEGLEKLRRGMYLMIREGSSEKNLEELLPLVTDATAPRCLFVIDDRSCLDLVGDGDMNAVVRKAIRLGLDPVRAIQLATINTATYFGLRDVGAVAPGYWADLVVVDDLAAMKPALVFYEGVLVAEDGEPLFVAPHLRHPALLRTMNMKPFTIESLGIAAAAWHHPIVEVVPGQIVTRRRDDAPKVEGGRVVADTDRDLLKLVVVERHQATGNIGRGLVKGFGLKRGALASSVAHDSHNIVAVGAGDDDLYAAINEVARLGGGLVVAADGKVIERLALPVAGLMSQEPLRRVADRLHQLETAARRLGCALDAPFATLSFMALPVIPEVRVTDRGVVDVAAFRIID